jgi:PKD repeat protein
MERDQVDPRSGPLRTVRVLLHLVREDDGDCPVTLAALAAMMDKVNDIYRGRTANAHALLYPSLGWAQGQFDTRIEFCWEIRTYDETAEMHFNTGTFLANHSLGYSNEVQVLINQGMGFAFGDLNPGAWIRYQDVGAPKALAHELGHCMGLIHPHEQVGCAACQENPGQSAAVRDAVNDFCSDTDPDPNNWVANCGNIGIYGNCTIGYPVPATTGTNVMAYAANQGACQSVIFTPQQANRMRCFLSNYHGGSYNTTSMAPCTDWVETGLFAKPTRPCVGQTVQFYADDESNAPLATRGYAWSFGDGSISNARNPNHAYVYPGQYAVSLTVTAGTVSHTYSRLQYITVGLQPVPYMQAFDAPRNGYASELPAEWEYQNLRKPFASWQRITDFMFESTAAIYRSSNVWKVFIGGGNPFWNAATIPVIGPNGTAGGAMAINNTLRATAESSPLSLAATLGDRDTLLSPTFDLNGLANPQMRFSFAHIPSAISGPSNCDWDYSTPALGAGTSLNAYGSAISNCDLTANYATCADNRISVKISTDCGTTWTALTDNSSRSWNREWCINLNTVPGKCCPFGFIPQAASNWDAATFDLCGVIGQANVQFMFEYEHSGNNNFFWIDDFAIQAGTAQPWQSSVVLSATDETCNGTLGSIAVTVPGPGTYSIFATDHQGYNFSFLNTSACTFSNLPGATGGKPYDIRIVDGAGNCVVYAQTIDLLSTLSFSTSVVNACQGLGGSITISGLPIGSFSYTISLNGNNVGSGTTTTQVTVSVPNNGTYLVAVTDLSSGNCGSALVTVTNNGSMPVSFTADWDCSVNGGVVIITSPVGQPGYVYSILNSFGTTIMSSTTPILPAVGQAGLPLGNYFLSVVGNGQCRILPFQVLPPPTPSFTAGYTNVPANGCLPYNGSITVTPTPAVGPYVYQLYDANYVAIGLPQSTGTFTGLPAAFYNVVVTNTTLQECFFMITQVPIYLGAQIVVPAVPNSINNSNCTGIPNGVLRFRVRGPLSAISNITIVNVGTGQTVFTGPPMAPLVNGGGFPIGFSLSGLPAGVYQVSATNTIAGCGMITVTINNSYTPLAHSTTVTNACGGGGGAIQFNALVPNGNYDYTYSLNGGPITTATGLPSGYSFTGLVPGVYTVTMSSNLPGACSSSQVTVTNLGNLSPTYQQQR